MKYYCVRGGALFPFGIRKITSRDVRLLRRCNTETFCVLPDAEQNLSAVQAMCEGLSKAFGVPYRTEFCLRSRTACVDMFLPTWNLRYKDWASLKKLQQHLSGARAYPFRFGLKLILYIKYFVDEASSVEQDLEQICQEYTDP